MSKIKQLDENNYLLVYDNKEYRFSERELYDFMSTGTTKGFNLYVLAIISLQQGIDLIVDEIENHFHKTLVENLIMLYKDKKLFMRISILNIVSRHY